MTNQQAYIIAGAALYLSVVVYVPYLVRRFFESRRKNRLIFHAGTKIHINGIPFYLHDDTEMSGTKANYDRALILILCGEGQFAQKRHMDRIVFDAHSKGDTRGWME